MAKDLMLDQINKDLERLCLQIDNRHVGSPGNQEAARYAADRLKDCGFEVITPEFDCIDWYDGGCSLMLEGDKINAFVSPYSLPCDLVSNFETAGTFDELVEKDFTGKIAVLHGELCKEQLMPKNFVFYNPEGHQRIIAVLEAKKPLAIAAITERNPELAGALYPFPLFEDGDFDIPSVYLTDAEGERILSNTDKKLSLSINSERIKSKGCNAIGIKRGKTEKRIVFSAHVDTKKNTPGALDDSTGIAILLSLAKLLEDYSGDYTIELAAFNGEDYYSAPGQMLYLEENNEKFGEIVLNVNIDGAGHRNYRSSVCYFNWEEEFCDGLRAAFNDNGKFVEVEPWYQGDHMIFVANGIQAIAITSENTHQLMTEIAHTPKDTLDNVDLQILYSIVYSCRDIVRRLPAIIH